MRHSTINDTVENRGDTSPLMILYHINLGFPLLDEAGVLVADPHSVVPRDDDANAGLAIWNRFQAPTPDFRGQVFYHDLPADRNGWASIKLINSLLGINLTVRFQKIGLPNLAQWKMLERGAYVLGLEPANCHVEGRRKERERGSLQFIEFGERRQFSLEIDLEESHSQAIT
jgi:hypothetical protein